MPKKNVAALISTLDMVSCLGSSVLRASVIPTIDRMPLSQEQVDALKNPATMIEIQMENPKKPGSKAAERFDRYKGATTIQDATAKGANWQDLSSDFEKGFLKVCGPKPLEPIASGSCHHFVASHNDPR